MRSPLPTGADTSTPLRIIALFIALSEALATAGAVATDGSARLLLTVFAVTFPFVVLAIFVWLLVKHTEKLYAPGEYTAVTTIETFALATRRQARDDQVVLRGALGKAVAAGIGVQAGGNDYTADEVRRQVVATFDQAIEEASVTLVRMHLLDGAPDQRVPVTSETTVQDLLNAAYFSLSPAIDPFTYGKQWILTRDHEALEDMGSAWADKYGLLGDDRLLRDVGIRPGTLLTAVARESGSRR